MNEPVSWAICVIVIVFGWIVVTVSNNANHLDEIKIKVDSGLQQCYVPEANDWFWQKECTGK